MVQKQVKKRAKSNAQKEKREYEENMKKPINQFLNARTEDGAYKYPLAEKLRKYSFSNPDLVLNDMRMSNSLLHEIKTHKAAALRYLGAYESGNANNLRDEEGQTLTKEECYVRYIKEKQVNYVVLSKLRSLLVNSLLAKAGVGSFTFELFQEFVEKTEKIVADAGYELFPDTVSIIEPL